MGDQGQHVEICKYNQIGFCKFRSKCHKKHNNTMCKKENECDGKLCSERHPKLCRNISKTGICQHKENCAYKHPQEKYTNQGFVNDAIMMCIVFQQQQITALSEEVKCLKLLVEYINDINKEKTTVQSVYPDDKEVTICVQKGQDENMKENNNKENKKAGKMSPGGEKVLVHKTARECYKCEECNYRSELEMSLTTHINVKHQCQKPESFMDAKFFYHECNTSYKTKKIF